MDHPEGASTQRGAERVDFDRRVRVEFRGAQISSDGGLLVMRELDDALGLSDLASTALRDTRRGKNAVDRLDGLLRQSVFGRLAGYEDVNDADRLAVDPFVRQIVGARARMAGGMLSTPSLRATRGATLASDSFGRTPPMRSRRSMSGWKRPVISTPSADFENLRYADDRDPDPK